MIEGPRLAGSRMCPDLSSLSNNERQAISLGCPAALRQSHRPHSSRDSRVRCQSPCSASRPRMRSSSACPISRPWMTMRPFIGAQRRGFVAVKPEQNHAELTFPGWPRERLHPRFRAVSRGCGPRGLEGGKLEIPYKTKGEYSRKRREKWSGRLDLNQRPLGPEQ